MRAGMRIEKVIRITEGEEKLWNEERVRVRTRVWVRIGEEVRIGEGEES